MNNFDFMPEYRPLKPDELAKIIIGARQERQWTQETFAEL